jgi:hypothetical protein
MLAGEMQTGLNVWLERLSALEQLHMHRCIVSRVSPDCKLQSGTNTACPERL